MSMRALKKRFLELLRSDWEFRRAVAAELGLLEILERLDKLEERMVEIEKRIEEHNEILREHNKRIMELTKRMEEHNMILREHSERIMELAKRIEEHSRRIEELTKRIEEHTRILEEHSKAIISLQERVRANTQAIIGLEREIRRLSSKIDALGARWGLVAEDSVRKSLYVILREYLGVARVDKWQYFDREGTVFGYPTLIEIDIIVKDNIHYLIEVKSSVDTYDVLSFNRKCMFYTSKTGIENVRKLIVTFYIDDRARKTAKELGIEVVTG